MFSTNQHAPRSSLELRRMCGTAADPFAPLPDADDPVLLLLPPEVLDERPSEHTNRINDDMAINRDGCRLDAPEQRTLHDAYYHELFTLYVKFDGDLNLISEHAGLFPGAILEWLDQPHVLHAIARYRMHKDVSAHLKTVGALFVSIDHLQATADRAAHDKYDETRSAVERRHSATALARSAKTLGDLTKPREPRTAAKPRPEAQVTTPAAATPPLVPSIPESVSSDQPAAPSDPVADQPTVKHDESAPHSRDVVSHAPIAQPASVPLNSAPWKSSGSSSSASARAGSRASSRRRAASASSAT